MGDHFRTDWSLADAGGLTPFASDPWVATRWSTEVLASRVEQHFGLPAVARLFGAAYLALVLTAYVACRSRVWELVAAVVTALVAFAAAPGISARPEVVSFILLAVTGSAWLWTWDDGRLQWVAGPHGLGLGHRPTDCGRRASCSAWSRVSSWSALRRTVPALVAAAMIGWLALLWARGGARAPWTRLLLFALAAGWALLVTRMVALGAVVLAPMLAQALEARYARSSRRPEC